MMGSCRSYNECRNSSLEDFSNIQWNDFFDDIRKPKTDAVPTAVSCSNTSRKPVGPSKTKNNSSPVQEANDAFTKPNSKSAATSGKESTTKKQSLQKQDLSLTARAKFDFVAQTMKEFNLQKGQTVTITKQVDSNWYMVQSNNGKKSGIVPVTYLHILSRASPENHCENGFGRAKFDLRAIGKNELSFQKGDGIVLLKKVDNNWYQGKLREKIGIVPVVYLDVTNEPKNNEEKRASITSFVDKQCYRKNASSQSHTRNYPSSSQPRPFEPKDKARRGKANDIFPVTSTAESTVSLSLDELNNSKDSDNVFLGSSKLEKLTIQDKLSSECGIDELTTSSQHKGYKSLKDNDISQLPSKINKSNSSPFSSSSATSSSAAAPASPTPLHSTSVQNVPSPQLPNQPNPDYGQVIGYYVSLYAFAASNDDELDLMPGDMVMVVEICDDGWYVGTNQSTGAFGTFPGNYVSLANIT